MKRTIDHIVYGVPNLSKAINQFEDLLGVRPVIGGAHLTRGTKNALLNLGDNCYLEILAKDEDNSGFEGSRWMGIDMIDEPKITRWSLRSDDLEKDSQILRKYAENLGVISKGNRKTADDKVLSWKMILPATFPEIDLLPFMTDWTQSDIHPTDSLEEGCKLESIHFYHPNPIEIQPLFDDLGLDYHVNKSEDIRISIEIKSPNGILLIS